MSGRHPLDAAGLALPHPWWPDARQATGDLELLRRFCNSVNRENGAERFREPADVDTWLAAEGSPPLATDDAGLARLIANREALFALIAAGSRGDDPTPATIALSAALSGLRFVPIADDRLRLVPVGSALDQFLGRLAQTVVDAQRDGSWRRLKACQRCGWVVYDTSKNVSARWCSMEACGGRHNARQYRARHAGASSPPTRP